MESFAAVVRILLQRIRAVQDSHPWPASAAAVNDRLAGVDEPDTSAPNRRTPGREAAGDARQPASRQGLELTVYGLPVPRGLPSS